MKITFVCTGNTCRSPLAQAIAQKYIEDNNLDIDVDSAGLNCMYGAPMAVHTARLIEEMGIFFTHSSQPLTQKLVDESDVIITMEKWQKDALKQGLGDKVVCMNDITYRGDIADPYGGSYETYQQVAKTLEESMPLVIKWVEK